MSEASQGEMMLTVFLKHRQSMNLAEINQKLEDTGFWKKFPPDGVEVVSWYVMMGIGQVVTLKLPAGQLRAVNLRSSRTPGARSRASSTRPTTFARYGRDQGACVILRCAWRPAAGSQARSLAGT